MLGKGWDEGRRSAVITPKGDSWKKKKERYEKSKGKSGV